MRGSTDLYTYRYPHPAVTADVAAFRIDRGALKILLIRRARDPHAGRWALPGGFVDYDEDLAPAARRELAEETGLEAGRLEQFGAFGRPGRDPRERVITIAYLAAFGPGMVAAQAGDDAAEAGWFDVQALPPLAFDHDEIIGEARAKLAIALEHGPIGFDFLPPTFTAEALADAHAVVRGQAVDAAALVQALLAQGRIAACGEGDAYRAVTRNVPAAR